MNTLMKVAEKHTEEKKPQSFYQKHRKKILGGAAATAGALGAAAAYKAGKGAATSHRELKHETVRLRKALDQTKGVKRSVSSEAAAAHRKKFNLSERQQKKLRERFT